MSETQPTTRATRTRETQQPAAITDELLMRIVEATEQRLAHRPNPMALNTFEEIEAFATHAARTQMVPKDYVGKPDNIILAVMQGKELGLPPIQAIQSIAMVNGRPSVWGDAVPGLCYARGLVEDASETFEGTEGQDDFTAVCMVKRKGIATPKIGRFSQADAKRAGLFGKAVHGSYPKRMMQWRARHYAYHDAFPDVLRGIGTREIEAEEATATPGWTMPVPEKGWFSTKPQATSDGWDNTWFNGAAGKLLDEPNAWRWLDLYVSCLTDAPTLRDVNEIDDLPVVSKVRETAPEDAKTKMQEALTAAASRFKTPAKRKAPATEIASSETEASIRGAPATKTGQSAPATGEAKADAGQGTFEVWLVDAEGEPITDGDGVSEAFTDPVAFAKAYVDAEASEFPGTLELFKRANHDGLALAMAASTAVAPILTGKAAEPAGEDYAALAEGILADIASLEAVADVKTWREFGAVKAELEKLRINAPALHQKVLAAADDREKEVSEPAENPMKLLAVGMIAKLRMCTTQEQITTGLGKRDRQYIADAQQLIKEAPVLWEDVKAAAEDQKRIIAEKLNAPAQGGNGSAD